MKWEPMKVTIESMKLSRKLDDDFYIDYLLDVEIDDRDYMPYQRWLCLRISDLQEKLENANGNRA